MKFIDFNLRKILLLLVFGKYLSLILLPIVESDAMLFENILEALPSIKYVN